MDRRPECSTRHWITDTGTTTKSTNGLPEVHVLGVAARCHCWDAAMKNEWLHVDLWDRPFVENVSQKINRHQNSILQHGAQTPLRSHFNVFCAAAQARSGCWNDRVGFPGRKPKQTSGKTVFLAGKVQLFHPSEHRRLVGIVRKMVQTSVDGASQRHIPGMNNGRTRNGIWWQ